MQSLVQKLLFLLFYYFQLMVTCVTSDVGLRSTIIITDMNI